MSNLRVWKMGLIGVLMFGIVFVSKHYRDSSVDSHAQLKNSQWPQYITLESSTLRKFFDNADVVAECALEFIDQPEWNTETGTVPANWKELFNEDPEGDGFQYTQFITSVFRHSATVKGSADCDFYITYCIDLYGSEMAPGDDVPCFGPIGSSGILIGEIDDPELDWSSGPPGHKHKQVARELAARSPLGSGKYCVLHFPSFLMRDGDNAVDPPSGTELMPYSEVLTLMNNWVVQ